MAQYSDQQRRWWSQPIEDVIKEDPHEKRECSEEEWYQRLSLHLQARVAAESEKLLKAQQESVAAQRDSVIEYRKSNRIQGRLAESTKLVAWATLVLALVAITDRCERTIREKAGDATSRGSVEEGN